MSYTERIYIDDDGQEAIRALSTEELILEIVKYGNSHMTTVQQPDYGLIASLDKIVKLLEVLADD